MLKKKKRSRGVDNKYEQILDLLLDALEKCPPDVQKQVLMQESLLRKDSNSFYDPPCTPFLALWHKYSRWDGVFSKERCVRLLRMCPEAIFINELVGSTLVKRNAGLSWIFSGAGDAFLFAVMWDYYLGLEGSAELAAKKIVGSFGNNLQFFAKSIYYGGIGFKQTVAALHLNFSPAELSSLLQSTMSRLCSFQGDKTLLKEIALFLIERGANVTPAIFGFVCQLGDVDIVKKMPLTILQLYNVEVADRRTPLEQAAYFKRFDLVEFLLDQPTLKLRVDVFESFFENRIAFSAEELAHFRRVLQKTITKFRERNLSLEQKSSKTNLTPMQAAIDHCNLQGFEVLLQAGCLIDKNFVLRKLWDFLSRIESSSYTFWIEQNNLVFWHAVLANVRDILATPLLVAGDRMYGKRPIDVIVRLMSQLQNSLGAYEPEALAKIKEKLCKIRDLAPADLIRDAERIAANWQTGATAPAALPNNAIPRNTVATAGAGAGAGAANANAVRNSVTRANAEDFMLPLVVGPMVDLMPRNPVATAGAGTVAPGPMPPAGAVVPWPMLRAVVVAPGQAPSAGVVAPGPMSMPSAGAVAQGPMSMPSAGAVAQGPMAMPHAGVVAPGPMSRAVPMINQPGTAGAGAGVPARGTGGIGTDEARAQTQFAGARVKQERSMPTAGVGFHVSTTGFYSGNTGAVSAIQGGGIGTDEARAQRQSADARVKHERSMLTACAGLHTSAVNTHQGGGAGSGGAGAGAGTADNAHASKRVRCSLTDKEDLEKDHVSISDSDDTSNEESSQGPEKPRSP